LVFDTFEVAIYHSTINYTTLGYGQRRHSSELASARSGRGRERDARVRLVDRGVTVVICLIRYRHRAEVTNGTSHHAMDGRPARDAS